ncbi:Aquaporin [Datura stramonium]|uniref:Aquaporin n=1 Tax=Datura stramonium TaxID=4076 RepID=A0ABS8TGC1_DATST|nr:Aquaporin [Datura stramonium]
MPIVIGNLKEATHPDTLKAAAAEFISMLIYIFAAEGFAASSRLTSGQSTLQAQLIAAAINHAFVFVAVVSVATNISGGHVNPAVTFAGFLGGHIATLYRECFIWIAQLLGSVVFACSSTMNPAAPFGQAMALPHHPADQRPINLASPMDYAAINHAFVFAVVVSVATNISGGHVNPAVTFAGFLGVSVATNISGGHVNPAVTFAGFLGAMNPAAPFDKQMVSWTWNSHWVYWLGTFIGAAIASLVYETIFITDKTSDEQLPVSTAELISLKEIQLNLQIKTDIVLKS